ncbi:MAG: GIY-YIG nuclease family protein [Patescibacteria group bacterium]|mgnify:CR=1 FL=1
MTPLEVKPVSKSVINHYVYVLYSTSDYGFYTGYTSNLRQRYGQHRQGKSFATKSRLPLKLVYYEVCLSWKDARAREKFLKSGMGKRYLKNRSQDYLTNL